MTEKYLKIIRIVITLFCVFIFMFFVINKLAGGARWSSGLPLGGVDNYLQNNGSFYTIPENGFTPGTSYFPGIIILSYICRLLFGYGAETAIILFGAIVALLTFYGFSLIAIWEYKESHFWLMIGAIFFFIVNFSSARSYLLEVHPDIPALMFFLWGTICMEKFIHQKSFALLFVATTLFFTSGLFKQNAVFLYIGLAIYIISTKSLSIKEKGFVLLSETIAGLCVLVVIFSMKGCFMNCVTVNALHPLLSLREYLRFGLGTIRHNFLFVFLSFIYFLLLLTGNIKIKNRIEAMWLSASIAWTLFCMYGAAKDGANEGNMEAAIITFMPFTLIIVKNIFNYIPQIIHFDKMVNDFVQLKYIKFLQRVTAIMVIFALLSLLGLCGYKVTKFIARRNAEKAFSSWLTKNFEGKNVAYNSIFYEVLNNAKVHKTTDFYTSGVWQMAKLNSDKQLKELSQKEAWDVILAMPELSSNKWPKTFERFDKVSDKDYPDFKKFYGFPIEVYIKR